MEYHLHLDYLEMILQRTSVKFLIELFEYPLTTLNRIIRSSGLSFTEYFMNSSDGVFIFDDIELLKVSSCSESEASI